MTWMLDKAFLERLDLAAYAPLIDPARRYRVQSNLAYGWVAGTIGDGHPTIVFVGRPRLSAENEHPLNAISFDRTTGAITTSAVAVDDEDGLADDEYVLGMLEDELGFAHVGHASVPAFKFPNIWHYAVVPLPFHLHDAVMDIGDVDAADRESARAWLRRGDYVLHCGNAYFMNADGEVESS